MPDSGLSREARKLVLKWRFYARHLAVEHARRSPLDIDELVSAAYEGLVRAARNYDSSRPFGPYAQAYIHGALADEARRCDHLGRCDRDRGSRLRRAFAQIEQEERRTPTLREAAQAAEIDEDSLRRVTFRVTHLKDDVLRAPSASPDLDWPELDEAMLRLTPPERFVIGLMYVSPEPLEQAELAEIMGVRRNRVSEIHVSALGKMRGLLDRPRE